MTPILILSGVEVEAQTLARALEVPPLRSPTGPLFGDCRVRVAAVGPGALRVGADWPLLTGGGAPSLVVSAGVCGALDPRLAVGDLVIPEAVVDSSGGMRPVTPSARDAVLAAAAPRPVRGGLVLDVRRLVGGPEEKRRLFATTGAVAVDMESAAVLARAAAAGCPAVVVRAVSDTAVMKVPSSLLHLVSPQGRLHRGRALVLAAREPRALAQAIGLGVATRRALRRVAAVLTALVASPNTLAVSSRGSGHRRGEPP